MQKLGKERRKNLDIGLSKIDVANVIIKSIPPVPKLAPKPIIEPTPYITVVLDDISVKLSTLIDGINSLKTTNDLMYQEFLQTQAEGEDLPFSSNEYGTVKADKFTIFSALDLLERPHPFRGYTVKNKGDDIIWVGFNVAISSLAPPITDVKAGNTRFIPIEPGEDTGEAFDVNIWKGKGIKNLYLLADSTESNYVGKFVW
jgi:hypothetical protein